ncbi:hypothetical protein CMI44_00865 [Candidatus Pacearchaeota archaeon]|jgi:histidine triad (HIT) family protein|nr:hypothetical protein [Candidatus Pacearchaeota archaeon]|tara:strand:- start:2314 stop:2664 length:351 start_codon:yes stop_codon:yes gene_type:complete
MTEDCIFCKIVKGEVKSEKVYENDNFFSVFDVNPAIKGHALVISKKHFETILELPSGLCSEFIDSIKNTALELMKKFNAEGFNLHANNGKVAGQIIPHFHIHIFPRKKDDGFKPCA